MPKCPECGVVFDDTESPDYAEDSHRTALSRNIERVMLVGTTVLVTSALMLWGPQIVSRVKPKLADTPTAEVTPAVQTPRSPLDRFAASHGVKPLQDAVVFVTKGIYGGDLQYSAVLRGKG